MVIETKLRKWGNSIGVILPKEYVKKENLKENQTIRLNLVKETDLTKIYGKLKGKLPNNTQKYKDELRREE